MDAIAFSHAERHSVNVFVPSSSAFLAVCALMSKEDDIRKLWARIDLPLEDKLTAYLDGYMMAFDMYPVCERHLFVRNDAYALLRDFYAVGADVTEAFQKVLNASDQEFADTGLGPDEIRRRKIEITKRALAAIERATSQRSNAGVVEGSYGRPKETTE